MKTEEITNSAEVIDSRDVIARIEYLEQELADEEGNVPTPETADEDEYRMEEIEELAALRALTEEAEGYAPDWQYGATLIRDSYFEDYARELAEEIGAVSGEERWPLTCIDWEKATRELQMDYTEVSFGEVSYWIR